MSIKRYDEIIVDLYQLDHVEILFICTRPASFYSKSKQGIIFDSNN